MVTVTDVHLSSLINSRCLPSLMPVVAAIGANGHRGHRPAVTDIHLSPPTSIGRRCHWHPPLITDIWSSRHPAEGIVAAGLRPYIGTPAGAWAELRDLHLQCQLLRPGCGPLAPRELSEAERMLMIHQLMNQHSLMSQ